MSSSVTPGTSPHAGVDVAGHGDVDDEQRRAVAARHHRLDVAALDEHVGDAGRGEQHVDVDERVGEVVERDRPAADPRGERSRARARCGSRRRCRATPRRAQRDAMPSPISPGAEHEHAATVERAERARRPARPRPTRPTPRGGRCRSRCGPACRPRPRGGTAREQLARRGLRARAVCHASRTWPRISLSPTIIESSPAATAEEVRDRGVVVVRVEVVGELVGRRRPTASARKSRTSRRGVEVRAARVDLGAVARGEHARPRRGARAARGRAAPSAARRRATVIRSSSSTGDGAVVQSDDDQRHARSSSFASSIRPGADRGRACRNRGPVANRRPRWNARRPASSSRASESSSSRVSYSGPSSSPSWRRELGGERRAAAAGADVTTRSPRRTTDISVNEQFAGSSAQLTQTRRASPASNTAAVDRGIVGGGDASQAPSRSAGSNARSASSSRARVGPAPAPRRRPRARPRATSAPAVEQRLDLAGRDRPAADHHARAGRATSRFTGYPASAGRVARRRHGQPAPFTRRLGAAPCRAGAVGRRTGSAARSRGRPCAATRPSGTASTAGAKLRIDVTPGVDQAVGDVLRGARRAWR